MKPKRTRIKDLRRAELLAAAHRVFMAQGLAGLTTARICEEAGMSAGILSYYFKGKDELLFAVVRMNNRILVQEIVQRLVDTNSRWQRLVAIVSGNFPDDLFEQKVAAAWLSVCAASARNPDFARLQSIFYRRLASNLASVFAGVIPEPRFGQMVLTIGSMIDGLWLRKSAGGVVNGPTAIALVLAMVEVQLTWEQRMAMDADNRA